MNICYKNIELIFVIWYGKKIIIEELDWFECKKVELKYN